MVLFALCSSTLLTLVWQKSSVTVEQNNTYHTGKTRISLALLDMLALMHILGLSSRKCKMCVRSLEAEVARH